MTNAIEQTRREMYKWLLSVKQLADSQASAQAAEMLELCLEIHLEVLRKESANQQSRLELNESLANGFSEQVAAANKINADFIEQRDTLRNRLQAFEMASQTSAEIIKGLREELKNLRGPAKLTIAGIDVVEDLSLGPNDLMFFDKEKVQWDESLGNPSKRPVARRGVRLSELAKMIKDLEENAASAKTDPFALGFPMVVRSEFDDRIRTTCTACNRTTDEFKKTTAAIRQEEGLRSGSIGCNGQAQMRCQHSYHHLHQHCIYCGDRK